MSEKWIYQVKMDKAGSTWKKIGNEGGSVYELVENAVQSPLGLPQEYKRKREERKKLQVDASAGGYLDPDMTISIPPMYPISGIGGDQLSLDIMISNWERAVGSMFEKLGKQSESARREQKKNLKDEEIFNDLFSKGYIREAVENPEQEFGSEYDTRYLSTQDERSTTDWQIYYNDKYVDAYLTREGKDPQGRTVPSIVKFLKGYEINIEESKVTKTYSEPRGIEDILERGMKRLIPQEGKPGVPILRRRIPASQSMMDAEALTELVKSQKPFTELLEIAVAGTDPSYKTYIKLLGVDWIINKAGHVWVPEQSGKISYSGFSYDMSILSGWLDLRRNGSLFFDTNIAFTSGARPLSFMSAGELRQLEADLPGELKITTSVYEVSDPALAWYINYVGYTIKNAIKSELERKAQYEETAGKKIPPDLGWALWRDVEFEGKAWDKYKSVIDNWTANLGAGISKTEESAIKQYYFNLMPDDSFTSTLTINQLLLRANRYEELPPQTSGDKPTRQGYDFSAQILQPYINSIVTNAKALKKTREKESIENPFRITPEEIYNYKGEFGSEGQNVSYISDRGSAKQLSSFFQTSDDFSKEISDYSLISQDFTQTGLGFNKGSGGGSQELYADFSQGSTSADFGGFQGMGTNQSSGAGTSASGGEGAALPYTGFSFTPSPFISASSSGSTRGGGGMARMPSSGIPTIPMPRAAANRGAFAFAAPSSASTITPTGLRNAANTSMPKTDAGSFALGTPRVSIPSSAAGPQIARTSRQPEAKGQQVIINNNHAGTVKTSFTKEEFVAMLMQEDTSVA